MQKRVRTQVIAGLHEFDRNQATPMPWPPGFTDLPLFNFYLRGYAKQYVYSEVFNDINHLKERITDGIHPVTPDIFKCVSCV